MKRILLLLLMPMLACGASFPIRLGLLQTDLNGGNKAITNVSYFVGGLSPTNIMQAGATTNQVLKWNGTNWIAMDDNAPTNGVNMVNTRTGDVTLISNDVYTALLYVPASNSYVMTLAPTSAPTLYISTLRGGMTLWGNLVQMQGTNFSNGFGITNVPRLGVTGLEAALDFLTNNIGGSIGVTVSAPATVSTNGNEITIGVDDIGTNSLSTAAHELYMSPTNGITGAATGKYIKHDSGGVIIWDFPPYVAPADGSVTVTTNTSSGGVLGYSIAAPGMGTTVSISTNTTSDGSVIIPVPLTDGGAMVLWDVSIMGYGKTPDLGFTTRRYTMMASRIGTTVQLYQPLATGNGIDTADALFSTTTSNVILTLRGAGGTNMNWKVTGYQNSLTPP